ncbi:MULTISPECIES: anti-sigma factor [Salimicrobium]|uniref:Anti-sigma-W factor RsiW n=2 Tax=Salimicrobium TaxID=351195 RepID=A0ABY1KL46_9BACI|nr:MULTISPECIES: anti-sigma factor [Salimicrobium]SDX38673.1 Putative zinc-finger [Salimicrobium album]SIS46925.1 Putative zinc-finger [Salimicrobium salexigens]
MSDKQCDNLIDYFNGQLSEQEEAQFENHLASCESCREELAELRELTESLPYLSEPVEPDSGMKNRVLSSVFEEEEKEEGYDNVIPIEEKKEKEKPALSRTRKRNWAVWGLAAALAASLVGNAAFLNQWPGTSTTQPEEEVVIDNLRQDLTLQNPEGGEAKGQASMVANDGESQLVVQAEQLAPLSGNEAYQVWLLEEGDPVRAGTFVTNEQGSGAVTYPMDELKDGNWDTLAITKEPGPDSETPQGEIVLAAEI